MLRFGIVASILLCAAALIVPKPARAALDLSSPALIRSELEIVVVEATDCIYCHLFRRDVWPTYEASQRARAVPMRFLDLNSKAVTELALEGPIESVPTALVLRNGQEVGRIPGYVGPEIFFHSIDRLIASTP